MAKKNASKPASKVAASASVSPRPHGIGGKNRPKEGAFRQQKFKGETATCCRSIGFNVTLFVVLAVVNAVFGGLLLEEEQQNRARIEGRFSPR